jgi:hypothetical protein
MPESYRKQTRLAIFKGRLGYAIKASMLLKIHGLYEHWQKSG